jgi:mannan endo-1,4-beta-mannosidase
VGAVLAGGLAVGLLTLPGASAGGEPDLTGADPSSTRRVMFGAYVEGMAEDPSRLSDFEQLVGRQAQIASYYSGYGAVFPGATAKRLAEGGRRTVLVSWDPGRTRFSEWASGAHDDYLDQIVAAARDYPYDIYVRPWPEMNGDWAQFQPTPEGDRPYGGTYDEFKAAWRHVVGYVRGHGATNVRWVFNPASDVYPATTPVARVWPGTRYVDVLGIDGFNWGHDRSWGRWLSFREIFTPMYTRLTDLHPTAPVWICEFGSKEPRVNDGAPADATHSKRDWLYRAFNVDGFPRIEAMVYFHVRKERDWRVTSSRAALRGARQALSTARYGG